MERRHVDVRSADDDADPFALNDIAKGTAQRGGCGGAAGSAAIFSSSYSKAHCVTQIGFDLPMHRRGVGIVHAIGVVNGGARLSAIVLMVSMRIGAPASKLRCMTAAPVVRRRKLSRRVASV
jgi:hypothetical protein